MISHTPRCVEHYDIDIAFEREPFCICEACICYDVDSEVILNCDCECHHATQ